MNKYFKFPAESNLGIGVQYIEFDDRGWAVRQAECYGDKWFNSNKSYHEELTSSSLCDQKLTESGIKLGEPVDAQEFEDIWNLSNKVLIYSNKKSSNTKVFMWIFSLAGAACFAFFLPSLTALFTGRLTSTNTVTGSEINVSVNGNPTALGSADKGSVNFACTKYKNSFVLISKVGNTERPFLKFTDSQKNWGEKYSPKVRCQIIREKLNFYAEKEQPISITLGVVNGYDVACFSKGYGQGCVDDENRGQILTLGRSGTNPKVRFNSLMTYFSDSNISSDYTNKIEIPETSSKQHYIYIDLRKFVKNEKNYYEFSDK